jgi:hypothetical protein
MFFFFFFFLVGPSKPKVPIESLLERSLPTASVEADLGSVTVPTIIKSNPQWVLRKAKLYNSLRL